VNEKRTQTSETGLEIAVIGMSGRFPGAGNINQFWNNLIEGKESVSFFGDEELEKAGVPPEIRNHPDYIKCRGGVLDNIEYFDAFFFNYTPREARVMDPQVRFLYECSWEALEQAGYVPGSYNGLIGVYVGASENTDWKAKVMVAGGEDASDFASALLSNKDFVSTRMSYRLNLKGPSYAISTGCSTSLVAIHMACRNLLTGECDIALAGGVHITVPQKRGYMRNDEAMASSDGHLRSYDEKSSGTVFGHGVGVVVLKTLHDASADGDTIYAVIKGSAVNNDGNRKVSFTAPSVKGQADVIKNAYRLAEVDPETIGYIETHGSGTELGDSIEIKALKDAFNSDRQGIFPIGTVKPNVGHLDSAAGVTGFIKTVLCLHRKLIPPTLFFEKPNPKLEMENSPFYVNNTLREWRSDKHPLRAAVSSFGLGGTNAHMVLEEAPEKDESWETESRSRQMILLSARTESALNNVTGNLVEYLRNNPGVNLANVAYTLQVGREAFEYRRKLICSDTEEAIRELSSPDSRKVHTYFSKEKKQPVVFMFPGLGAQYVNMGLDLYRSETVFREETDRCFKILKPLFEYDVKDILYPGKEPEESRINEFEIAQAVIFVFEYALAKLMIHWGGEPDAMIGYSLGEYAAACLSGVFSLEDALKLIVLRGRLIRDIPAGIMLSVPLPLEEVKPLLNKELSPAIDNGPSCIVAGPTEAVEAFERQMKENRYLCMRLTNSRAIHSKMMEPALMEFERYVSRMSLNRPRVPYISNVTGTWISVEEVVSPGYWSMHLRHTVEFANGVRELVKMPSSIFVEVGPGRELSALVQRYIDKKSKQQVINLVQGPGKKTSDVHYLLNKFGQLWLYGKTVDWSGFYSGEKRCRIPLPTYPFEHQRYWIDGDPFEIIARMAARNFPVKQPDIADWFYIPSWKRSGWINRKSETTVTGPPALIFMDKCGLGKRLAARLGRQGREVVIVKTGASFKKENQQEFQVNPGESNDYDALFSELKKTNKIPGLIYHLWNVTGTEYPGTALKELNMVLDLSFYSLLNIARAIGKLSIQDEILLEVATNNMQEVIGEKILNPEKSVILGPVHVIPKEYPNIRCRSIDVVFPETGSAGYETFIDRLLGELGSQSPGTIVAYRGNQRWVPTFDRIRLEKPQNPMSRLKDGGVYLITGGLGGVGLVLAGYLAGIVRAKFIFTTRSSFPRREDWQKWLDTHQEGEDRVADRIRKVLALEAQGAEILILEAEAADMEEMQTAVTQAEKQLGPVNGIIHAAGIADFSGVIQRRTRKQSEDVLAPKVKGTLILDEIFKDADLDFFVLCSSLGSFLTSFGEVAYASANAFLDAFTFYKTLKDKTYTLTINWDNWQETGMIAEAVKKLRAENKVGTSHLKDAMLSSEAVEAFGRLLEEQWPRVAISTKDLNALVEQADAREKEKSSPDESAAEVGPAVPLLERPALSSSYEAPETGLEKTMVDIWRKYFGVDRLGVNDDFFELGGDSLMAISLSARMHKGINVNVPITEIFKTPTIKALAEYVNTRETERLIHIDPAEEKEFYPLSSGQKRLYILHQLDSESAAYNESKMVTLRGEINREKIGQIFLELIRRHEAFRTSFVSEQGEPVQKIYKPSEIAFELEYYEADEEIYQDVVDRFIRPFDLAIPPLMRAGILKVGDETHILMLDIHHIITDGVSLAILIDEFTALSDNKELLPVPLQYKDYSQWQNSPGQQKELESQGEYWSSIFENGAPELNLPLDYKRPPVQNFEGRTIGFLIDREDAAKLKELAGKERATIFMTLMAVLNVFFSKICGQQEIVIGTPIAGRHLEELQRVMGLFVNMLAIRSYPAHEKTFREFLNEVKETTLEAFENQLYPFEMLVEKAAVKRDMARNPLFDVLFQLENIAMPEVKMEDIEVTGKGYVSRISKFDITFFGVETGDDLYFQVQYCTRLFNRQTIDLFTRYFKEIISAVASNPARKLWEISGISVESKREILQRANQGLEDEVIRMKDKTLQHRLKNSLGRFKNNIAVECGNTVLTYGEFGKHSDNVANRMIGSGIPGETCIGVLMDDRVKLIYTAVGILLASCVFVPMDPSLPQQRLKLMIKTANIKFVFVDGFDVNPLCDDDIFKQQDAGVKLITIDRWTLDGEPLDSFQTPKIPYRPEDKVYIYFTSGTTGTPKAILGKNGSLLHFIEWEIDTFGINENFRFSQLTTPGFDAFLRDVFVPLCSGGTLCIPPDKEILSTAEGLIRWLDESGIHMMHTVPSIFRQLADGGPTGDHFNSLKYILLSGEKIEPPDLAGWYRKFNQRIQLVNLWGTSETTMAKTYHFIRESDIDRERVPVGKPLRGCGIMILDENMNLCEPLITGKIYIRTPFRSHGYFNDQRLTDEKFIPNPFNDRPDDRLHDTGDIGRFLADGNIEVLGRSDRQVKIRGIRVELGEIESVLIRHDSVKDAAVVKKEISQTNEVLYAYIEMNPEMASDPDSMEANLKEYLSLTLPGYMVPSKLIKIEKMPRTPNGKKDYNALPDPYAAPDVESEGMLPRDHIEKKLHELWIEILGIPKIGIQINFFVLGGNSLNLMALISKIHQTFDVRISLGEMFSHSTIEKQARLISAAEKEKYLSVEPAEEKEYYPLSSAQKRLYIVQQMDKGQVVFNGTEMVKLEGEIDREKIRRIFRQLIERHDIFRTSFTVRQGEPVQEICRVHEVTFELGYHETDEENIPAVMERFVRPFDLSVCPMFRASLLKVGVKSYFLVLDIHHIIIDGLSRVTLIKEFMALYRDEELPPLTLQYKDFSEWQNSPRHKTALASQEEYWLKVFEDRGPLSNLPLDFKRPPIQRFDGDTFNFIIARGDAVKLKALASTEKTTTFMTLLAVFNVFLSKVCGQEDIVIGTPITGRHLVELQPVMGVFLNMLPLRNYPRNEKTFREFLNEVKETTLEAFENQLYPFEDLVEKVVLKRDRSRNPLFDVLFQLENIEIPEMKMHETKVKTVGYENHESKFDLTLFGVESGDDLFFQVQYCTRLFKPGTIEYFSNYITDIAASIVENPDRQIRDIAAVVEMDGETVSNELTDELENE